jgi:thiol-disulfide isomerase/thioredoxin
MTISRILLVGLLLLTCKIAFSSTLPLTSCSQLRSSKAVVLVYAEWCPHCRSFLPSYNEFSNDPKYAGWKFYTKENNDFHAVCGVAIKGVPILFKNNMRSSVSGSVSDSEFSSFLNS